MKKLGIGFLVLGLLAISAVASAEHGSGAGGITPHNIGGPIEVFSNKSNNPNPVIEPFQGGGPIEPFYVSQGSGVIEPWNIGGVIEPFEHKTIDPFSVAWERADPGLNSTPDQHGPILWKVG